MLGRIPKQPLPIKSPPLAAAIVLAGGQSRRMGQDKALLQLQGEALLARTCRLALAVSDFVQPVSAPPVSDQPVSAQPVSDQPGANRRVLVIAARWAYRSWLPQGCELLLEDEPQGPLKAFAQGLNHLAGPHDGNDAWVLLLACDLPLLSAEDFLGAIAALPALPMDVDAYLPPAGSGLASAGGRQKSIDWEPLCGFYRQRCLQSLQEALQQGHRSFQRWLTQLNIAPWTDLPPEHLLNCNRPQDWEQVLGHLGESIRS